MPSTLSIMTYNIRGALYDDGQNSWPFRAPLNVRLLEQRSPNLIGFQEVHQENLAIFHENHGYTQLQGTPYNDHAPFQYTAITWNSQRLRQLDAGGFWLSETPEVHSRSWDTSCVRSATWAKLEWLETGLTFLHLNTHLDHISELARVEGTKLIMQFLDKYRPTARGDWRLQLQSILRSLWIVSGAWLSRHISFIRPARCTLDISWVPGKGF